MEHQPARTARPAHVAAVGKQERPVGAEVVGVQHPAVRVADHPREDATVPTALGAGHPGGKGRVVRQWRGRGVRLGQFMVAQPVVEIEDTDAVGQRAGGAQTPLELRIVGPRIEGEDVDRGARDLAERTRSAEDRLGHAAEVVGDRPRDGEVPTVRQACSTGSHAVQCDLAARGRSPG
nr:hypothetical protein GCM10025699_14110 [Microbacterium flavescens]